MGSFLQALCTGQTWVFAIFMTVGVVGLAKSWMRLKQKHEEKVAQDATESK